MGGVRLAAALGALLLGAGQPSMAAPSTLRPLQEPFFAWSEL